MSVDTPSGKGNGISSGPVAPGQWPNLPSTPPVSPQTHLPTKVLPKMPKVKPYGGT